MPQGLRTDREEIKQRIQQLFEHRFHRHAEAEARERDAELRRADVTIQMRDDVPRGAGAAIALRFKRSELRIADAHERQFRRHEKAVEQHQHDDREELQADGCDRVPVHQNFISPNITRRMSLSFTTATSARSGDSTIAVRWPARCICRNATSSFTFSPMNSAGVM